MISSMVSVIIPVYNGKESKAGAEYLREAIESALAQTYENKEIIVVNDGSRDNGATERVILEYGDRVRYIYKDNGGVSSALNCGIENAKGEWISWLSHDDLYTDNKISEQMRDVRQFSENGGDAVHTLFYCLGSLIDAEGNKVKGRKSFIPAGYVSGADALKYLFSSYVFGGCGFLLPKNMFSEIGKFDETMRYMQDIFMWEKAFIKGYGVYINEKPMSITRLHSGQVSTTGKAYEPIDRAKVGEYLIKNLGDIKSSDGRDIAKECLYDMLRSRSFDTGKKMYKQLKLQNRISAGDYPKIARYTAFGVTKKVLKRIYYAVRLNCKR